MSINITYSSIRDYRIEKELRKIANRIVDAGIDIAIALVTGVTAAFTTNPILAIISATFAIKGVIELAGAFIQFQGLKS